VILLLQHLTNVNMLLKSYRYQLENVVAEGWTVYSTQWLATWLGP